MNTEETLHRLLEEALKQLDTPLCKLDPRHRPIISVSVLKKNNEFSSDYSAGNARAVLVDEGEWEIQSVETYTKVTITEEGRRKKIATTATEYIRE